MRICYAWTVANGQRKVGIGLRKQKQSTEEDRRIDSFYVHDTEGNAWPIEEGQRWAFALGSASIYAMSAVGRGIFYSDLASVHGILPGTRTLAVFMDVLIPVAEQSKALAIMRQRLNSMESTAEFMNQGHDHDAVLRHTNALPWTHEAKDQEASERMPEA